MQKRKPIIVVSGIALLMLLLVFSIFNTGCGKEEEKICAIFLCMLTDSWQDAQLVSEPIADPVQAEVSIEWDTQSYVFPFVNYWGGIISFSDTLDLDTLLDYTVELTSDVGDCEGTVTLPGATSIIDPEPWDTLPLGGTATVTWNAAQEADFYYFSYYLDAYDAFGSHISGWDYDTIGYITPTSYTIPAAPFNAVGAAYYRVHFYVYPYCGPIPTPGQTANMSGSANGFLGAEGEGDHIYFWVGTPVKKDTKGTPASEIPTEKERFNTYLKAFGIE
jgi:hypothetical protein